MIASLEPADTALLVMDYQPAILGSLHDPAPMIAVARNAAELARARGATVGFVRVAFTDEDYARFPADSMMGNRVKAARPNLDVDRPTTGLPAGLEAQPGDLIIRKTRVSAFSAPELHAQLSQAGITTLLLAGVHTSGVVLSTVRQAHDLDYRLIVLADACADPDSDVHSFLIDQVFPKQGEVITTAELPELFAPSPAGS